MKDGVQDTPYLLCVCEVKVVIRRSEVDAYISTLFLSTLLYVTYEFVYFLSCMTVG
jgi:hypothetical protein